MKDPELSKKLGPHPLGQVNLAKTIAEHYHFGQLYDGLPYFRAHLEEVVKEVHRIYGGIHLQVPFTVIATAYLHDILEDTPCTATDLLEYGIYPEVIRIVEALTDEPGATRAEKKAKTYPKIKAAGAEAVLIKIADRIANVTASRELVGEGSHHLETYRREHAEFKKALQTPGILDKTWVRLENLLFIKGVRELEYENAELRRQVAQLEADKRQLFLHIDQYNPWK